MMKKEIEDEFSKIIHDTKRIGFEIQKISELSSSIFSTIKNYKKIRNLIKSLLEKWVLQTVREEYYLVSELDTGEKIIAKKEVVKNGIQDSGKLSCD